MRSFLSQFHLGGMGKVKLEAFVYNVADQLIDGYSGGVWPAAKFGNVSCLTIPGDEPTVTLNNPLSGVSVTTNRKTASVIFSFMVAAWFWERYSDSMEDSTAEEFSRFYNTVKDQVFATVTKGIDAQAFFKFTD